MSKNSLTNIQNIRTEESVKKAISINYNVQIENINDYYTVSIEVFIDKIKDPDVLVSFLKLDIHKVRFRKNSLELLLDFLLYRYSEKQLLLFFVELEEYKENIHNFRFFIENIIELKSFELYYKNNMDVKCELYDISPSLFVYLEEIRQHAVMEKKINNDKERLRHCVDIEEYSIEVPHTAKELYECSNMLIFDWSDMIEQYNEDSCFVTYFEKIVDKKRDIYCFHKKQNFDFVVEIREEIIIHVRDKKDSPLNYRQHEILNIWKKRFSKQAPKNIPIEIIYTSDRSNIIYCWTIDE
jgi:hypothetical protein